MEAYSDFARVYDTFMDNIPYEEWTQAVISLIEKYGVSRPKTDSQDPLEQERNLVVDLGCGTGTFTLMMEKQGYDMTGIDYSFEMLDIAREKTLEAGEDIMYICADMRDFELYCTAGTFVSVCDSINYLLNESISSF